MLMLPNEPYPGLRPFLDYEAPLLMGRAHQVREIIKRLETTRFVAVVGGSGCGKSSLIRAGVVPKLRGFGIPSEGDYWIPVVYTPGTTRVPENTPSERPRRVEGESPVTRLAWKLSQVLRPAAKSELDASRRREIATVFRQGAGFARLVEAYSDELRAAGPSGADGRFIFVIDQFEELFHPNNHGNPDVIATIEAVISHFYNPHERCFVVLTMRSEHLADCAAYLELPDAINKSLYLVRRLNEQEIREAIVGPAKYFLRLKQRAAETPAVLPADVAFDESVIERLLQDVAHIANDADHLPLLQHLLARTWHSSCLREATPNGGVPAEVRWKDLERAVDPGSIQPPDWLRATNHVNALRCSLDNWAEHTYHARTPAEQAQIDAVLRRLAFRDPNSGFYFQQRVDVDDPSLHPGLSEPRKHLRTLLERGFLDTVNYLFWDDENPERVTLKVSHEAFIRGWERFRTLIDDEAERFEEFVSLLRKCAMWKADASPRFLLEGSEVARIEAARLEDIFRAEDERRGWFRHLLEYRDGERLALVEPELDEFLAKSRQQIAEKERERREALEAAAESRRNRRMLMVAGCAALGLALVLGFVWFIHVPVMDSALEFNAARNRAAVLKKGPDAEQQQLRVLLDSALQMKTTQGRSIFTVVDTMQSIPPFSTYKQYLETSWSEPYVTGPLRQLLTSLAWDGTQPNSTSTPSTATLQSNYMCDGPNGGEAAGAVNTIGTLVRASDNASRAIFMTDKATKDGAEFHFYGAALNATGCTLGRDVLFVAKKSSFPAVVVDSHLKYLAAAQSDPRFPDYVVLFALEWGINPDDASPPHVEAKPLTPLTGPKRGPDVASLIREEVRDSSHHILKPVKTWPARAGVVVSLGGRYFRLFANDAVPQPKSDEEWILPAEPLPDSGCKIRQDYLKGLQTSPAVTRMFQQGSICLEIGPSQGAPGAASKADGGAQLWVLNAYSAFQAMQKDRNDENVPLASFPIGVLSPSEIKQWWIGKPGTQWDGWIALEQPENKLLVAPWATSALVKLGCEVMSDDFARNKLQCPSRPVFAPQGSTVEPESAKVERSRRRSGARAPAPKP